jgi:hypothetical protein
MFLSVFKNKFIARSLESIYVGDDVELQYGTGKVIEINYEKSIGVAEIDDCVYFLKWKDKIGWHSEERALSKDFYSEV